jgi:hypothetical protein
MSSTPPTAFADRRQAMLQRLAELGMMLAERLVADGEPTEAAALQFARVAKAVRQTLALEAQLAGALEIKAASARPVDIPPWEKHGVSQAQWDHECREEDRLNEADGLLSGLVHRDPRERLRDALDSDGEALVGEVADAEFFSGDLPLSEIIARIAQDLGLEPDWHGLTEDDWYGVELRTRADLKAGVTLGEPPPGWPKLPGGKTAPSDAALSPPDG